MSEHESAALWRIYLKSNEGIAIQSTRNRLAGSFDTGEYGVWIVPVQYIDYINDDPPMPTRMAPFRYKRKSFEHEKKLRAIIYADVEDAGGNRLIPPSEIGIRVKTDLERLIGSVYVAPTAPDWFYELTVRISSKFGVTSPVFRSSLATDQPAFI